MPPTSLLPAANRCAPISALLERDVRLDNDANCFALSEAWDDEFRHYPLVMGLILGTGVGGELLLMANRSPGAAISRESLVISVYR